MSNAKRLFPPSLLQDEFIVAAIESVEIQLRDLYDKVYFFADKLAKHDFSGLPEVLIDYLAYEFHVDYYEDLTYQEKCNVLSGALEAHRKKGTKHALERVLSMLNLRGNIQEWFEYGGDPYHFKVKIMNIGNNRINQESVELLERLINVYKNNRSWIESFEFYVPTRANLRIATALKSGESITAYPRRD